MSKDIKEAEAWQCWQYECPHCEAICEVDGYLHVHKPKIEVCWQCNKEVKVKR